MDDNNDDFEFGDLFDDAEFMETMKAFQKKIEDNAMNEAYNFIHDVGILFWIRRDMYVENNRKTSILNKMVQYFEEREEFEKCAYLMKGVKALKETKSKKNETSNE